MKIKALINLFEQKFPSKLSEDWDNTGLLVGSPEKEVNKVLLCVDVTSKILEEAQKLKVDLVISHHPLIFKPLKRIVDNDTKQKLIIDLIKSDIAVISLHTNLDVAKDGVNEALAKKIGLTEIENVREHAFDKIFKLAIFVPSTHLDVVRDAICMAGAGFIGNYSNCTFASTGKGSFKALEGAKPYVGNIGEVEHVDEIKIETIVSESKLSKVISAMKLHHPYEEVAYDVIPTEIKKGYSYAKVGKLNKSFGFEDFIKNLKTSLNIKNVRYCGKCEKIEKVVVFSGSFDGNFDIIRRSGADVLITGDVKHNTAIDAIEEGYLIVDCGHFSTEVVVLPALQKTIQEVYPELTVYLSTIEQEPFSFS